MKLMQYRVVERAEVERTYLVKSKSKEDAVNEIHSGVICPETVEDLASVMEVFEVKEMKAQCPHPFSFKKPRDVETFIAIWGWMDYIVNMTKRGRGLTYWKCHSVPRGRDGKNFLVQRNDRCANLRHSDIVVNPYWYDKVFEKALPDYARIYKAFVTALEMG